MNIIPLQRYKFELSHDEATAIKILGEIDCSQAQDCSGCPLFSSSVGCLKVHIRHAGIREGIINNENDQNSLYE